jgi:D-glycero-D-manno-heptose 1,7-bisphosphate phosphatase
VFLDRDGTLNVRPREHEYVTKERDFVWLPRAAEGVARLAQAGFVLTVVSNQRGVARGLVMPSVLREIEERIQDDLAVYGCAIGAFRYCFHDRDDGCQCRKPKPGMIVDLARELDLDLDRSWVIGDAESDVRAGAAAGCRTAFVGDAELALAPDVVAPSLFAASDLILQRTTEGCSAVQGGGTSS